MAGRPSKTPYSPFTGLTLSQWQASEPLVKWAKSDAMFNQVVNVMMNGFHGVDEKLFPGYKFAVEQLLALRIAPMPPRPQPQPTYSEPPEGMGPLPDEDVEA